MKELLKKLRDRPFYIWSSDKHQSILLRPGSEFHGRCCFNNIIGLPTKDGKEFPLFDYEHMIYKALTQDPYLNGRNPTPEEEEKFRLKKIELESLVSSKKGSINNAQNQCLKEKDNILVHNFKLKHLWIKKATGLGITEFMLRFMARGCA